jgi:hypothetical protein
MASRLGLHAGIAARSGHIGDTARSLKWIKRAGEDGPCDLDRPSRPRRSRALGSPLAAQLAALVAIVLHLTLPDKLTIRPGWLVPLLETLLLVALFLATPGEEVPGSRVH